MTDRDIRIRARFATLARKLQQRDNLAAWQCADYFLFAAITLGIRLKGHAYTASVLRNHAAWLDEIARRHDAARPPVH